MSKICSKCGKSLKLFNLSFTCHGCGKVFCSDCIEKVHYNSDSIAAWYGNFYDTPEESYTKLSYVFCPKCAANFKIRQRALQNAIDNNGRVELVSINYKGHKNTGHVIKEIHTDWHRDKSLCEKELRIHAALLGCNKVINVSLDTDTDEETSDTSKNGVHKYTVFCMSGECCK